MNSVKNLKMVQLALLIAIQIVLTITPLGFLNLGLMTITLMHIPTLVGALVLGAKSGAVLGFVFGISSIISAHMRGTPDVYVFSPLFTGSARSLIVSLVPRIVFPVVAALLFALLCKVMSQRIAAGISAGVATILHTLMVLSSVYLLFGEYYAERIGIAFSALFTLLAGVAATNGTVEAVVAVLACAMIVPPLRKIALK